MHRIGGEWARKKKEEKRKRSQSTDRVKCAVFSYANQITATSAALKFHEKKYLC